MVSNSNKKVTTTIIKKKHRKRRKRINVVANIQITLAAFCLILVTIGATYAYYRVAGDNNFSSTNVRGTVQNVGNVILSRKNANLSMHLTAINMIKQDSNINFYATRNGKTTEPTEEVLGTITASGNGVFNCEYDLVINANEDNNMYTKFQEMNDKSSDQIILTVNGDTYDFNKAELFPIRKHYTINGLEEGNPSEITASLKIVNRKDIDQSDLADTSIILLFTVENFECQLKAN